MFGLPGKPIKGHQKRPVESTPSVSPALVGHIAAEEESRRIENQAPGCSGFTLTEELIRIGRGVAVHLVDQLGCGCGMEVMDRTIPGEQNRADSRARFRLGRGMDSIRKAQTVFLEESNLK